MKPSIDFFLQRTKKPTSNIPTKMFDPSNNEPKFLENTIILYKTFNSRVVIGFTKSELIGVASKWKIAYIHVQ